MEDMLPTLQCLGECQALLVPTACRDHVRSDTSSSCLSLEMMTLISPLGCPQAMTDGGRFADAVQCLDEALLARCVVIMSSLARLRPACRGR